MSWRIPLFKICWDQEDIRKVTEVIASGMYWAEGPSIEEFEAKIAKYIGSKYCAVFNSGTSGLHAALLAYGIKKDDEVIVPSFTFIATANAPLFVGAKPVFADIEEETFGLDPDDLERRITSKTKAIIAIHYGGCPCKMKQLKEIAQRHSLILIEDAAEAFGAKIGAKKVGAFGDAAVLSFCQNKIITTGEGGAVITNSRKIFEQLKLIRSHGRIEKKSNYFSSTEPFDYISLGYNFRMPTFVAALGIAQLKKTNKIVQARRENARYLTSRLNQQMQEVITPEPPKGYFHAYQLYTVRVSRDRDGLMKYLSSRGIMTKVYFQPVHLSYFYQAGLRQKCSLPLTESIAKEVLTLPVYPGLTKKEMDYLLANIKTFLRRKK